MPADTGGEKARFANPQNPYSRSMKRLLVSWHIQPIQGERLTMTPNPSSGGRARAAWLVVTVLCIGVLTGVNGYRAATQSVTHDEAVTYDRYVRGPLYQLVSSSDANNHVLHSLLCRASVS